MNTQHTPGPWTVRRQPMPQALHDGHRLIVVDADGHGVGEAWLEEDAQVMAAAPDMLAALRLAADQDCCELDGRDSKGLDACFSCIARAAVAKATGAQS